MDEKLPDSVLKDGGKPAAVLPEKDREEPEETRPAPRCPDSYCFEDGM